MAGWVKLTHYLDLHTFGVPMKDGTHQSGTDQAIQQAVQRPLGCGVGDIVAGICSEA